MKNFYFTFGRNSVMSDYFQMIVAEDVEQATKKMFEQWGRNWAFGYDEDEFAQGMYNGWFKELKPLNPLYATRVITVKETMKLTSRFQQILGAAQMYKLHRLQKLSNDIANAFDVTSDVVAKNIYLEVEREILRCEVVVQ